MTDELQAFVDKVRRGAQSFADEMREKGIHVALGSSPTRACRCVTCGEAWPCEGSKTKPGGSS